MGKCCCVVTIALVALLVLGLSIGIPLGVRKAKQAVQVVGQNAVNAACQATSYPDTCNQTFSGSNATTSADSRGLTKFSVLSAQQGVNNTLESVLLLNATDVNVTAAVEVCVETLGMSSDQLNAVLLELDTTNSNALNLAFDDMKTRVSAAMELHTTCIDTFLEVAAVEYQAIQAHGNKTDQLLSNALAFINALAAYGDNLLAWKPTVFSLPAGFNLSTLTNSISHIPGLGNRKLLSSEKLNSESVENEDFTFPSWFNIQQQRHLLATPSYDAVVAQDGSGAFKTIQAAVDASPQNSLKRYVIYIKAGVYQEQVRVPKTAPNLMFVGDGINRTVITGSRSVALTPGMTTFKSATLIVEGTGFIGQYLSVENTAGSAGHQAVALRVTADKVAFYQCSFDSYQDTLYAHTFRQFYRECEISGTVDFIFGNGAIVFQSCNVIAKKSTLFGQQNTYTAQGRTDPNQNFGIAFQNCTFDGTPDLKANTTFYKTYLGRPWKAYSVCVHLKSDLMGHIDPTGWLPWNTTNFGLTTSFFAEYQNFGAGSSISQRVSWSHQIKDTVTATNYQAATFINANNWLPAYSIPLSTTL